jgi:oligopeptide transport system substrate-binding protein
VLRIGAACGGLASLAVLAWLALGEREPRADFVVACDELRTIDPARVSWQDEMLVASALFEGLMRLNPQTLRPEPGVAERFEVDASRLAYTFQLRPARWSNGEPVRSTDFRFAWLYALDPACEAPYASLLFVVEGAEAYYRSRLNDTTADDPPAAAVAVECPDERTLRVRLAAPCPYFLELACLPIFGPLYPPLIERRAYRDGRILRSTRHLWTRPEHIVCNGAFTLRAWDFKRRLLLARNGNYWDAGAIDLESIELLISGNPNASLVAYETGRIDLLRALESSVARALKQQADAGRRPDFHLGDRFATYFLRVNCRRPPLDNAELRAALSLAVDREALCRQVLSLGETPADTYVPRPAIEHLMRISADGQRVVYQPPTGLGAGLSYEQRVALARQRLADRGLDRPGALRPLELAYANEPPIQRRISEALQSTWEQALGIRIELRVLERKVLSEKIRTLDYDLARSDWYGDFLDPVTFLEMFTSNSGQNRTGWRDDDYDELLAAASREPSDQRRYELLAQAERKLCERELPIIPLYFKTGNFLLRPPFTGVSDNVLESLPVHRIRRGDSAAGRRM